MRGETRFASRARTDHLVDHPGFPPEEPSGDGDGPGGYVCFACGRSTKRGEPFVCVSRLWLTSPNPDAPSQVIDAIASLQACVECTLRAASHRLTWKCLPRLANAEMSGLYTYAGLLTQAMARRLSDRRLDRHLAERLLGISEPLGISLATGLPDTGGTHQDTTIRCVRRSQCHQCRRSIHFAFPRMVINVELNLPMRSGMQLSNVLRVGEYCNPCSRSLFPIRDDGRMNLDIL